MTSTTTIYHVYRHNGEVDLVVHLARHSAFGDICTAPSLRRGGWCGRDAWFANERDEPEVRRALTAMGLL